MSRQSISLAAAIAITIATSASYATDGNQSETIAAVQPDTLLHASKAESLTINSTESVTKIVINHLDDSDDNFYYETKAQKRTGDFNSFLSVVNFSVTDITVAETPREVNVVYTDNDGKERSYTFSFPDPDNRQQSSYIGSRWHDLSLTLSSQHPVKWSLSTAGLSLGWVTPTSSSPYFDPSMGRSIELSWLEVIGVRMSYCSIHAETGIGFGWRNFVTSGDRAFIKNNAGQIALEPYPADTYAHRSRIKLFSLQLPVLFGVDFGHHRLFSVNFGPIINFNTSASIETQYKSGDHSYTVSTSHIGQRPVTVDAYLALSWNSIGLYARYSPMNILKKQTGMDFGAFSTGIVLVM